MAKKVTSPKVGKFVYRPYGAQNPGKIKKILPKGTPLTKGTLDYGTIKIPIRSNSPVEVAWIDGTTTIEDAEHLSDFDALIADHQKKLNTHTSKLPALQKL